MSALTPFYITGYTKGLQNNKKPFLLPDQAWSTLENAYTWRERVLKRQGNFVLGRLQRNLVSQTIGTTSASGVPYTVTITDIFTTLTLRATEPNAEIKPGTFNISVAAPDTATFTDNGNGTFSATGLGVSTGSYIDYVTGKVVLVFSSSTGGKNIDATFSYFPALPGMGIQQFDLPTINEQQTIWWDQKYAYTYTTGAFQEFIPGTNWNGTNSNFFWAENYQGAAAEKLFYVTNFFYSSKTSYDPLYYTDGSTWTAFNPNITAAGASSLKQARILIPYFNRLLALNTWEGPSDNSSDAIHYFNRCRFSALGDPTLTDAWRQDIFGQGGFLDAPTNEQITGATFVKNTLVVDFEYSTWQLRYVGEYGLPFIWERVSSDFGSGSTFSGILFDNYRLKIGDSGITRSNSIEVKRIDLEIPDQVFGLQNNQTNNGALRIWGVRDFQKELVYWNYADSQDQSAPGTPLVFPDKVLLYNYRNDTWAIFRDNITCFGTFQIQNSISWNSNTITWDDQDITWDDPPNQVGFPAICALNQQGFGFLFGYQTFDDPSLSITGVGLDGATSTILQLTVPNHNLLNEDIIYIIDMMFLDSSTLFPESSNLNGLIFSVTVIDANTIQLSVYDSSSQSFSQLVGTAPGYFAFTPTPLSSYTYVGGGQIALIPRLNLITKDINLYQSKGVQNKISRIDFLFEPQDYSDSAITINILQNASDLTEQENDAGSPIFSSNLSIASNTMSANSDYFWYSYYQTMSIQYFKIQITYSDELMNNLNTQNSSMTLYAINAWTRPSGRFATGASVS